MDGVKAWDGYPRSGKARKDSEEEEEQMVTALAAAKDTPSFDQIGDALLNELWRRLKNPIAVMDLPAAQLMRLSQEYMKLKAGRPQEAEREVFDPAQIAADSNLPRDRKSELLADYINGLREQADRAEDLLLAHVRS